MDDSFENDFDLVRRLPNERSFCLILSYAFSHHIAVSIFTRLGRQASKLLEKSTGAELESLCYKDPDVVEMFRLIGSIKGLGFRSEKVKYDIEFPTRNHLKVFLANLIKKRRRQQAQGLHDLSQQNSTAIISSTDNCEEQIVSHLCKNMFTPRDDENQGLSPRGSHAIGNG